MILKRNDKEFKVGIYIRLSKEDGDKAESESVSNQRSMMMHYIEKSHLHFIKEYIDDGISGTTFDRPGFHKMISDIEAHKINMVITKDLSRLGRDYIKTGFYIENYFPEKQVRYVSLLDNLDTSIESAAMDITPFKAVLNDMYAKDISKKIRSVFKQKKESGKYLATYPPYGYQKKEVGALTVDPYASKIVKQIFEMYISGLGTYKIAQMLNAENMKSPGAYLGMTVKNQKSDFEQWKASSVSTILKNEMYLGLILQGKTKKISYKSKKKIVLPREAWITHERSENAIIDLETFEHAQKMMKVRINTRNRGREHLLKGILYCRVCKNKLQIVTKTEKYKNRQYERTYAVCSKANKYKGTCDRQYHPYEKLETEILSYLKAICNAKIDYQEAMRKKNSGKEEVIKEYQDQIQLLCQKNNKITEKLDKIYADRLEGIIEEEDYKRYAAKIVEERKLQSNSIFEYQEKIKQVEEAESHLNGGNFKKETDGFLTREYMSKEALLEILEKIEVDKDKHIWIYFNFKEIHQYGS